MKVYLAARYERRLELLPVAVLLESLGHKVTSRWINGFHDNTPQPECAKDDITDIQAAQCLILLSENGGSEGRGGRHFEVGYAYALGMHVIIVGQQENVFHHLADISIVKHWDEAIAQLRYLEV